MNRKAQSLVGVALFMSALAAHAGDILDAVVVKIASNKTYGKMSFIKTDKSKPSAPGCQINLSWDYVMPLVTEHDKKLYAMLLAARASGSPVSLNGTGNCDTFASIESLLAITW